MTPGGQVTLLMSMAWSQSYPSPLPCDTLWAWGSTKHPRRVWSSGLASGQDLPLANSSVKAFSTSLQGWLSQDVM